MSRREELLAVMRSRDAEIARSITLADRYWYRPLLARWLRKETQRLLVLNQRDSDSLPPQRHRQPQHRP